MDTKVTWKEGLSFTGTAPSGFNVPIGTDVSMGGANDGFRPLELMAISLAGCTALDVISIIRKKQQAVTSFDVQVHTAQQREHPHVFTQATITYVFSGHNLDEAAVRRAIELSTTKYCPAFAMLSQVFPIALVYEVYEDNGMEKTLVLKSEFKLV